MAGDALWPIHDFDRWLSLVVYGRSIAGAILFGFLTAEVAKPILKYPLPPNDYFAVVLPFSMAIGRIGCWLAGCCRGIAYDGNRRLWRFIHQLHHAPRRLDVAGVMYVTPFEVAINTALFVLVSAYILSPSPANSMALAYIAMFYGMFQHFNIRTPHWLGYFIQRPVSHCVHHQRGVHDWNYSDFPFWDMLLGSFRNPRDFQGELGFAYLASESTLRYILGKEAEQIETDTPIHLREKYDL